jgi:hypothetical protein
VSPIDKFKSTKRQKETQPKRALPKKADEPFVQVSLEWGLAAADALRCPRLALVILLHRLAFQAPKGAAFPVSNQNLKQVGVSRDTKREGLYDLETRGLVEVVRHGCNAPLVRMLGRWWR